MSILDPDESLDESLADNPGGDGRLSPLERVRRDAQIITALKRGISGDRVGAQFGLSGRQVRRIRALYRQDQPDLDELEPAEIVKDTLDGYEAAIEELALIASTSNHDPTKVGAIRTRLEAMRGRIELLQSVGVLPHDLGQIRVIDDAQAVVAAILKVFDAYEIPEEVGVTVMDVIEGRTVELPSPPLPDAPETADESVNGG